VFANDPSEQSPQPIRAWGRAPHEAVVLEPSRSRAYLTEDASTPNGLLYRWSAPTGYRLGPHIADSLGADAGTLEALALLAPDGSVLPDLSYVTSAQIGRPFTATWKTIPDRHATTTSLRSQLDNAAITRGKKLEGAWGTDRGMYFTSSFAAAADVPANATPHDGQLWWYDFRNQTLTLVAYFPYNALLHQAPAGWEQSLGVSIDLAFDGPDNVHVSPYGSLILAEDGVTANHILAWSPRYGAQAIVRNRIIRGTEPSRWQRLRRDDGGLSPRTGGSCSSASRCLDTRSRSSVPGRGTYRPRTATSTDRTHTHSQEGMTPAEDSHHRVLERDQGPPGSNPPSVRQPV
jgi:hypothetical protein